MPEEKCEFCNHLNELHQPPDGCTFNMGDKDDPLDYYCGCYGGADESEYPLADDPLITNQFVDYDAISALDYQYDPFYPQGTDW